MPATRSGTASARRAAARAPIASATRYATSAESIPPDKPEDGRSKPAWRSWPRMNPTMIRAARRRCRSPARPAARTSDAGHGRGTGRRSVGVGDVDGPDCGVLARRVESVAPGRRARRRSGRARGPRARGARRAAAAGRSARGGPRRGRRRPGTAPRRRTAPRRALAPSGPMTSEPPQNVIDSSTPTRFTKTTKRSSAGRRSASASATRSPCPGRPRWSPRGRGRAMTRR